MRVLSKRFISVRETVEIHTQKTDSFKIVRDAVEIQTQK